MITAGIITAICAGAAGIIGAITLAVRKRRAQKARLERKAKGCDK